MLRRLMCAASRSAEPSGKSSSLFVIHASKSQSSIFDRRISSHIVSTRIETSIVFDRANRGLLAEAPCSGGGGCIACDRNEEEECFPRPPKPPLSRGRRRKHLRPSADERCEKAGSKDGIGVVGMEEAGR
jgi:hypothetical protein